MEEKVLLMLIYKSDTQILQDRDDEGDSTEQLATSRYGYCR